MSTALVTLSAQLAEKFDMGDGKDVSDILKATAFKSSTQVSDAQMTALLVVANQYGLNPFTREIFAFPDKGGIVPVVGVDGWSRIMNDHAQFDGMEFKQDAESCTCIIYRKDRSHSISATEYMSECKRSTQPWQSHPKRMLRHKAMIQAARLAFGFGGIYDQDEAERIVEVKGEVVESSAKVVKEEKPELPVMNKDEVITRYGTDEVGEEGVITKFSKKSIIEQGEAKAQTLLDFLAPRCVLTQEAIEEIKSWEPK